MHKIISFIFSTVFIASLSAQVSIPITFQHTDKQLKAVLTKPASEGKFPVVIIGPGSGPNDMDGTIPLTNPTAQCLYPEIYGDTLKIYKDLADKLVKAGYAVFRYEKVEYTYGINLGEIKFEKLWMPLETVVEFIKTRKDIEKDKIILLGHSESAYLIPHIANKTEGVAALIAVAGARQPFDSLLAHQLVDIAGRCNNDTSMAKMQSMQIQQYFTKVRNKENLDQLQPLFGVPAVEWSKYYEVVDNVAKNYNEFDKPVLFIGLGKDLNVPLAELERFKKDVPDADFKVIPDVTHYMNLYIETSTSQKLVDTIVKWLDEHDLDD